MELEKSFGEMFKKKTKLKKKEDLRSFFEGWPKKNLNWMQVCGVFFFLLQVFVFFVCFLVKWFFLPVWIVGIVFHFVDEIALKTFSNWA